MQLWRGGRPVSNEPYYTTSLCANCRTTVHGLNGRWTCTNCGTSSPYEAGPPLPAAPEPEKPAGKSGKPPGKPQKRAPRGPRFREKGVGDTSGREGDRGGRSLMSLC
ncbi:hypothetical protein GCM10027168_72150 [Streptomyces capparidis]